MFQRSLQGVVLVLAPLMVAMPAMSADAPKPRSPAAGDIKEVEVYQLGTATEKDSIYLSAYGGGTTVHEHNLRITAKSVTTGEVKEYVAMEAKNGRIFNIISKMKPGDFISMTAEKRYNHTYVRSLDAYQLRPGEDRPTGFVFVETLPRKTDAGDVTLVKLYKLGRFGGVTVPSVKGEGGKVSPDPQISAVLDKLKKGDSVEVTTEGGGAAPTIKTIQPYALPENAVVSKVTAADVKGGKTPALEVSISGSTTTILVPGRPDYNGRWVPDSALSEAVKKLKEGDKVAVRFRNDGEKCWLKEIAKVTEPAAKT